MTSKWRQKYSPPQIIEPVNRGNLGTSLYYFWWTQFKQRAKWWNSFKNGEIFWMNNKAIIEIWLSYDMKNSADLGGCYPPQPLASVVNTLLDYYCYCCYCYNCLECRDLVSKRNPYPQSTLDYTQLIFNGHLNRYVVNIPSTSWSIKFSWFFSLTFRPCVLL